MSFHVSVWSINEATYDARPEPLSPAVFVPEAWSPPLPAKLPMVKWAGSANLLRTSASRRPSCACRRRGEEGVR